MSWPVDALTAGRRVRTAFKEWAAICRALASGRQDVILRKGGITEPGGAFRPEYREFLLMPTFLHQSAESLVPQARELLVGIDDARPAEGSVVFTHSAEVVEVHRITDRSGLDPFRDRHVWAEQVVDERFHRWKDELHLLEVAVHCLPSPVTLPWRESYGGCRSWVELEQSVDLTGALPVKDQG
ncbi:MAG: DUF1802 family protein [Planctomycetota bacterium]|nr:MAG: DUF1802 family protein [Planctomycetota bacterium]